MLDGLQHRRRSTGMRKNIAAVITDDRICRLVSYQGSVWLPMTSRSKRGFCRVFSFLFYVTVCTYVFMCPCVRVDASWWSGSGVWMGLVGGGFKLWGSSAVVCVCVCMDVQGLAYFQGVWAKYHIRNRSFFLVLNMIGFISWLLCFAL